MTTTITYPAFNTIIRGNDLSPIVANGVLLDLREDFSSPDYRPEMRIALVDALRSNSQGTLGFTLTYGSLTQVRITIAFYRNNTPFLQTASTFQGGEQVLKPMSIVLNSLDIPDGSYQYEFPIPPCDGIKIVVSDITGTNTGSSITNFHLALRTN